MHPNPPEFRTVSPYLLVHDARAQVAFIEQAFDAKPRMAMELPDGRLAHAEIEIGDSLIMLGEPNDPFGPFPASLFIYVDNSDERFAKAVGAGGEAVMQPMDMTHAGVRYGAVRDPNGNLWWIAQHLESVTPEEEMRRIQEHGLPKPEVE